MSEKAIKITNLSVRYGRSVALSGISLEVEDGDFLGIIGPNGGGKSTLLKVVLGLVKPYAGSVSVFGKAPGERNINIGYVPQLALMDKRFPITVAEVVMTGRLPARLLPFYKYSESDTQATYETLERLGISHLAHRRISHLSGGEFQKMLVARALVQQPNILLLDEPTANVDAASRMQIFTLLKKLSGTMTVIFVTHDLVAASENVQKLACLNTKLVYHGDTKPAERLWKLI